MKVKLLQLGVPCTESYTKATVTPTVAIIRDGSNSIGYGFRTKGLDKATGKPHEHKWVPEGRLDAQAVEMELPVHVLGTDVEHASGFKGKVEALVIMQSGCIHLAIQPTQLNEDGSFKDIFEASHLECTGAALKPMTEAEKQTERETHPSPIHGSLCIFSL